jgi:hypothetical protein
MGDRPINLPSQSIINNTSSLEQAELLATLIEFKEKNKIFLAKNLEYNLNK